MATRLEDQARVAAVARSHPPPKVIPSFGYHPWFSHLIYDDADGSYAALDAATLKSHHYTTVLSPPPDAGFISLLPPPRPLSALVAELRGNLESFPGALVGEIGLDRGFRLPYPADPGAAGAAAGSTPERREVGGLTVHRVALEHQKKIFKAQLGVAGALGRAASIHGVQCHGVMFDTLREVWAGHELSRERPKDRKRRRRKAVGGGHEYLPDLAGSDVESEEEEEEENVAPKPFPPRICLHSFSAPVETLKQYLAPPTPTRVYPSQLFFSFSSTINARPEKGHLSKIGETVCAVPDDSVLIESDLHTAGEEMDLALEEALGLICKLKGWEIERGARQLDANWRRFSLGEEA